MALPKDTRRGCSIAATMPRGDSEMAAWKRCGRACPENLIQIKVALASICFPVIATAL